MISGLARWVVKSRSLLALVAMAFLLSACGQGERQAAEENPFAIERGVELRARCGDSYLQVYEEGSWRDLLVKGVNIGTALPGRWFTDFPADRELYRQWFEQIAALNANSIRVYTLLDPAFYAVLAEHNANRENETLWLIQEIWPDDEVPGLNFHNPGYKESYMLEIELTIDALHGSADIPARPYRAYGNYSVDVSPYLLAILIGRELEPEEVAATDALNVGLTAFEGEFVRTDGARDSSPTEVWLAEMCDYTLLQSEARYGRQYPVAFVSWPTLDPLHHPTEWDSEGNPGYNDREVVDPRAFIKGPSNLAGLFGAYHIYPNYPDFMNNEPAYQEYSDDEGVFRYRGYLDQFMAVHPSYPALVAEFGISTSLNTAHLSPDGLHHGGLSEEAQGEMTVRMMRSILEKGYAGGVIFEWSDEWAKKTWNTEPYMVPYDRQVLWQNTMCPEQNYGILAVEPAVRDRENFFEIVLEQNNGRAYRHSAQQGPGSGRIDLLRVGADEAYLYLEVVLGDLPGLPDESASVRPGLLVAVDTGIGGGDSRMPVTGLPDLPGEAQFLLHISPGYMAELLVVPSYNRAAHRFYPLSTRAGYYERIEPLVNREMLTAEGLFFPALFADESRLHRGVFDSDQPDFYSLSHWYIDPGNTAFRVRLPWMLLNIADPSEHILLADESEYLYPPLRDQLSTAATEGLRFYLATYRPGPTVESLAAVDEAGWPEVVDFAPRSGDRFIAQDQPYLWQQWQEPQYRFRLKESYRIISDYFAELED